MRRKAKIYRNELAPDPRFNNVLVTRFINYMMVQGKKSTSERIFYGAVAFWKCLLLVGIVLVSALIYRLVGPG